MWPVASGEGRSGAPSTLCILLTSDIAVGSSTVITKASQIAGLSTPYLEVDPGVRAVLRDCLRPEDSESAGVFGKQGIGSCRTTCLFQWWFGKRIIPSVEFEHPPDIFDQGLLDPFGFYLPW